MPDPRATPRPSDAALVTLRNAVASARDCRCQFPDSHAVCLHNVNEAAVEYLAALASSASEDGARLDWLEESETGVTFIGGEEGQQWLVRSGPLVMSKMARRDPHYAETLRAAIDAARTEGSAT